MNRKQRRTFASLARRRKWPVMDSMFGSAAALAAMDHVSKLDNKTRRLLGASAFQQRHEIHRRGNVLLRLYA